MKSQVVSRPYKIKRNFFIAVPALHYIKKEQNLAQKWRLIRLQVAFLFFSLLLMKGLCSLKTHDNARQHHLVDCSSPPDGPDGQVVVPLIPFPSTQVIQGPISAGFPIIGASDAALQPDTPGTTLQNAGLGVFLDCRRTSYNCRVDVYTSRLLSARLYYR